MSENSTKSKIHFCSCEHEFQDQKYGKNKRVFNKMVKEKYYRCTVCNMTKTID